MYIYCIYNIFCSWYSDEATIYKVWGSNPSGGGGKIFMSFQNVQTGSGAHPASCYMGTGVLSRGKVGEA